MNKESRHLVEKSTREARARGSDGDQKTKAETGRDNEVGSFLRTELIDRQTEFEQFLLNLYHRKASS